MAIDSMAEVCGGRIIEHDHPFTPYMFGGLVMWAFNDERCRESFRRDTGHSFDRATLPLDAMIDEATGAYDERAKAFIKWCAENLWGMEADDARTDDG